MNPTHCPLCYSQLEIRDVAPCADCRHPPEEMDHLRTGMHKYSEMRVFGDLSLVLCDVCQVDFGSYDPEFFGLPRGTQIGYSKMNLDREITNPMVTKDKYCSHCGHRLAFLDFVVKAREANRTAAR